MIVVGTEFVRFLVAYRSSKFHLGTFCKLVTVKFPALDTAILISSADTFIGSYVTEKTQLSKSKSCFTIPFSSSRALPISVGHPIQRTPLRMSIPSTLKATVIVLSLNPTPVSLTPSFNPRSSQMSFSNVSG